MICDASHMITNVEAKWPGSVHDARMYRESNLSRKFQEGELHSEHIIDLILLCLCKIAQSLYLIAGQFDGWILGDRGYPCLPMLITPYPNPAPGPQTTLNRAHSRTRVKIENTFGILKSRFQCLRGLRVCPERACDIIVACAVLHNIATLRKEMPPPFDPFLEEEHIPQMDSRAGQRMREYICQNHFN